MIAQDCFLVEKHVAIKLRAKDRHIIAFGESETSLEFRRIPITLSKKQTIKENGKGRTYSDMYSYKTDIVPDMKIA